MKMSLRFAKMFLFNIIKLCISGLILSAGCAFDYLDIMLAYEHEQLCRKIDKFITHELFPDRFHLAAAFVAGFIHSDRAIFDLCKTVYLFSYILVFRHRINGHYNQNFRQHFISPIIAAIFSEEKSDEFSSFRFPVRSLMAAWFYFK